MIKSISWETIYKVWSQYLWPKRLSAIESTSAMAYLGGIDGKNMSFTPTFLGYYINDNLAGVNSGHMCADNTYRSRGLYVFPEFRSLGIGSQLLTKTIETAKQENANLVWSLPRKTSWSTYRRAGFKLSSDWHPTETSEENAYCYYELGV